MTLKTDWVDGEMFNAAAVNTISAAINAGDVHAAVVKGTPVDADEFGMVDSAATPAFGLKRLSWANLKAAILAWFGPVTATLSNKTLVSPTINSPVIKDLGGSRVVDVGTVANAVNFLTIWPSAAGVGSVSFNANGTDPNIGIALTPKGSGNISINSMTPVLTAPNNASLNLVTTGTGVVQANGIPVMTKVNVPSSATAAGKPGQVAADATHLYAYTGDGTAHTWVRSAVDKTAW